MSMLVKFTEDRSRFRLPNVHSLGFYCPGCKCHHSFHVEPWKQLIKIVVGNGWMDCAEGAPGPVWHYNGNPDKPTFTPSLLYKWEDKTGKKRCHLYVTNGKIQFLADSTHKLAGQTVEMEDETGEIKV